VINIDLSLQADKFAMTFKQSLPTGAIIGLFGSSGSGKSSLIRQLLGFDQPFTTHSKIYFNEELWQDSNNNVFSSPHKRGIGYLPQTLDLFPHLTVSQNIDFGIQNAEFTNRSQLRNLVLGELKITDLSARMPNQLSGGQKQRVALARAIMSTTNLLLLDEPFSAIGEEHLGCAMRLLKTLKEQHGFTIIFASHSRVEHAFLDDFIVTFNQGLVEQVGDYARIATDIEARFAQRSDALNYIGAVVERFDDHYSVNRLTANGHLLWAGHQAMQKNTQVVLEVKAQDISLFLTQNDSSSMLNGLPVTIASFTELVGHQYLVKLAFEGDYLITFITKKSFDSLGLKTGLSLFAKFKAMSVIPIKRTLIDSSTIDR
jgi:molybdate transport system ATP-binding protein